MRIAYTNLVDSGTVTASSENPIYPIENVQVARLAKPWQTIAVTGVNAVVDLGSALAVNTVAIIGHTITTSATLNIEANSSDSWGSPSWSTSLTALSNMILKYLDASQTYQYWRFTIEDVSAASAYINIGRLWLGTYRQMDTASTVDFNVRKYRSDTVTYGRDRQKFATEGAGWRSFDLSFKAFQGTMLTAMQTLYDTVGNHDSVIFSNFDSLRTYPIVEPVYCSIDGNLDFRHNGNMRFDFKMTLTEDR